MPPDTTAGERASSQVTATILLVGLTIVLALLVLLFFKLPALSWGSPAPPAVFVVCFIGHYDETHPTHLNYDSRIVLEHRGTTDVENSMLSAEIYANDALLPCRIETMNGHDFISTPHYGVQRMWGSGCSSLVWRPGEKTGVDLADGSIHPGDTIRVDILQNPTGVVISRHSCIA
ncbi:MAG: hypothetical protein JXA08_03320 [Methanomicrobiaceae archaeon]|nr:hypothetical protein [Methanomicrobiaceae archaeon]